MLKKGGLITEHGIGKEKSDDHKRCANLKGGGEDTPANTLGERETESHIEPIKKRLPKQRKAVFRTCCVREKKKMTMALSCPVEEVKRRGRLPRTHTKESGD